MPQPATGTLNFLSMVKLFLLLDKNKKTSDDMNVIMGH